MWLSVSHATSWISARGRREKSRTVQVAPSQPICPTGTNAGERHRWRVSPGLRASVVPDRALRRRCGARARVPRALCLSTVLRQRILERRALREYVVSGPISGPCSLLP